MARIEFITEEKELTAQAQAIFWGEKFFN